MLTKKEGNEGNLGWLPIINTRLSKMIKSRVKIKHFSIVGLMSPGWVRTQVRTHSDICWTRGLGLGFWPTGLGLGLGLWSNGLGLGLGLWSNGLGLTPDGLGLELWPCGLGLTARRTSPDSLQHWFFLLLLFFLVFAFVFFALFLFLFLVCFNSLTRLF